MESYLKTDGDSLSSNRVPSLQDLFSRPLLRQVKNHSVEDELIAYLGHDRRLREDLLTDRFGVDVGLEKYSIAEIEND